MKERERREMAEALIKELVAQGELDKKIKQLPDFGFTDHQVMLFCFVLFCFVFFFFFFCFVFIIFI